MKKTTVQVLIMALVVILAGLLISKKSAVNPPQQDTPDVQNLPSVRIGEKVIEVEVADSPEKRMLGLSNRSNLPEGKGMLFIFDRQNISPSFWMKDMLISLDIIWINDGKIIQIDKNIAPPEPQTPETELILYKPAQPVDYVLEVAAGFSDKYNINVGTSVDLSSLNLN